MTCSFCGCRNADGEHRCRRCGRKDGDSLNGARLETQGALAAVARHATEVRETADPRRNANLSRATQRRLFEERPASNVIPFETYAPPRPRKAERERPAAKTRTPRSVSAVSDAQRSLDFLAPIPDQPRTLGTTVEAVIICEAPVATPLHRAIAAALDWSMVLIGYGLFLLAFSLAGGRFDFTRTNLVIFGATLPLLAFTYGLFWTVAGVETAGMRWTRLRLITFEGFPPEPNHRVLRFAGSCLSFCTVLGLLWSLADEESLTWQDHISRTFPTPRASESQVFHRR